jgi:hypothetical protein
LGLSKKVVRLLFRLFACIVFKKVKAKVIENGKKG